jgi:hypothetical protein
MQSADNDLQRSCPITGPNLILQEALKPGELRLLERSYTVRV